MRIFLAILISFWFLFTVICTTEKDSLLQKNKRRNRQAVRAASQHEERERMLKEIALKQKSGFVPSGSQINNDNNNNPSNPKYAQEIISVKDEQSAKISEVNKINSDSKDNIIDSYQLCPDKKDTLTYALYSFWSNDLLTSYMCIKTFLNKPQSKNVPLAQSIGHLLTHSRWISLPITENIVAPDVVPPALQWEILGPFPSGKLEMDADPAFTYATKGDLQDSCTYILKLPKNVSLPSELSPEGFVTWKKVHTQATSGLVEVSFSVDWGELAQSLGSRTAFEFQGWARSVTYVRRTGLHILDCRGVHTVYVRAGTDNVTRILTGNIYHAPHVLAALDMSAGPLGIVLPLKGTTQAAFVCNVIEVPEGETFRVYAPRALPDLIVSSRGGEVGGRRDWGLLLSPYFSIPVLNVLSVTISVQVVLDSIRHVNEKLFIRIPGASGTGTSQMVEGGQLFNIPLEIYSEKEGPIYFPCRQGFSVPVVISSSRSTAQTRVAVEFSCRHDKQSFMYSFIDHDGTISSAAAVMPQTTLQSTRDGLRTEEGMSGKSVKSGHPSTTSSATKSVGSDDTCSASNSCAPSAGTSPAHPLLLTLHGTGVEARNQADAHKYKPLPTKTKTAGNAKVAVDFVFGVEGFWLVAPTRHGAHNWESVGLWSAFKSATALADHLKRHLHLPQMILGHGIISGHSMGGHGALVTAAYHPSDAVCVAALSSWIRKEEYGDANVFFGADAGSAFVDSDLRRILAMAMSNGHVDQLISNFNGMETWLRVGKQDHITHPWFSRRMHRLLQATGAVSTYEEVPGQGHWWWDTIHDNDGGVVNDAKMRKFYSHCLQLSQSRLSRENERQLMLRNRTDLEVIVETERGQQMDDVNVVSDSTLNVYFDTDMSSSLWNKAEPSCVSNFTLSVTYPPDHSRHCGVQVLQQFQSNARSIVNTMCVVAIHNGDVSLEKRRSCRILTSNVRRLRLWASTGLAFGLSTDSLAIDGVLLSEMNPQFAGKLIVKSLVNGEGTVNLDEEEDSVYVDICWYKSAGDMSRGDLKYSSSYRPYLCQSPPNALKEKTLQVYGPIRQIQSKALLIVYGTPQEPRLRVAIKDLAIYLANSYFSSHHSTIQVVSDLQYKTSKYVQLTSSADMDTQQQHGSALVNMLFIGGPSINKVMRKLVQQAQSKEQRFSATTTSSDPLLLANFGNVTFGDSLGLDSINRGEEKHLTDLHKKRFCIANHCFKNDDAAMLFTFPIALSHNSVTKLNQDKLLGNQNNDDSEYPEESTALAVCIHANTLQGYLHMGRLAWPTVPPMVRAPFANYIPDYLVLDSSVWNKGLGGVKLAGYWSPDWSFSPSEAYVNPERI